MYLNTYNYFKYFCYNKIVKSNKPLIIKSVKSAMHSLLTPLVLTIFKCIFHCFISRYFSFEVDQYTVYGKTFEGENFCGFRGFFANRESFPLKLFAVYSRHNGLDLMHRKSFPMNSVFCAHSRKFSPSKVLLYTV